MNTEQEAYAEMMSHFQKQLDAQKKICCWKDPNVALVGEWLQAVVDYSRVCFKYDGGLGVGEEAYRTEYHEWIKEYTQLNCTTHQAELN